MTGHPGTDTVAISVPAGDALATQPSVRHAVARLRATLEARRLTVLTDAADAADTPGASPVLEIVVGGPDGADACAMLARASVARPVVPEALALVPGTTDGRRRLLACGSDARGLGYAVLDLADRAELAADPVAALLPAAPIIQQPASAVRSVMRLFTSQLGDTPWFHDRGFWRRYLAMLVGNRFNRFSLTLGLGYNLNRHVTDAYLYFAYPFLLDVPGYRVRVPQVPDEERDRNLETLRFIGRETVAHGLDFQLGIWTHAYQWVDSPGARHTVEGLTPENHAAYCRDALGALLAACPEVSGVTLRTHGESGVPEGSWEFWRVVLDGIARSGRPVAIDLHAKGLDEATLDAARATGMELTVSPKLWAEHLGPPYHQAAIRDLELPREDGRGPESDWERFMSVSVVSRPFTRYGYGDFLREDRDYRVVYRIWPGTQRLLAWGDPAMAAALGRQAGFAGADGLDWFEPLSFRGREGSDAPGPRDGYADPTLSQADDWRKFEYAYRLMGRLTYDPGEHPDAWRRYLRAGFGAAADHAEGALARASRILPLVTVAHHASASNNFFWPELPANVPVVPPPDWVPGHPYLDAPRPARFGTVSPLDPELFLGVEAFVEERWAGGDTGRWSPLRVAGVLERLSGAAAGDLAAFRAALPDPGSPAARRLVTDVSILEALGRFFAGKLRAATLHALATRSGSPIARSLALDAYRAARAAWVQAADAARGVYVDDLTFGPQPWLRGTWSDRLLAIDRDVDALRATLGDPPPDELGAADAAVRDRLVAVERHPPTIAVRHRPPGPFIPAMPIEIVVDVEPSDAGDPVEVWLRYRRVNQAERWSEVAMEREGRRYAGTIPAETTDSPYPIQYRFVLRDERGVAWPYPDLGDDLCGQPYILLRQARPPGEPVTRPA